MAKIASRGRPRKKHAKRGRPSKSSVSATRRWERQHAAEQKFRSAVRRSLAEAFKAMAKSLAKSA